MDAWMDYDEARDEIKAKNREYLDLFEQDLIAEGLKSNTIKRHLVNADLYINNFLLYEEPFTMDRGTDRIDSFFEEFFIRKCIWSTPMNIKRTAIGIKKFYKCMMAHGFVKKVDYEFLCSEIKGGLATWQNDCAAYNDSNQSKSFSLFF